MPAAAQFPVSRPVPARAVLLGSVPGLWGLCLADGSGRVTAWLLLAWLCFGNCSGSHPAVAFPAGWVSGRLSELQALHWECYSLQELPRGAQTLLTTILLPFLMRIFILKLRY